MEEPLRRGNAEVFCQDPRDPDAQGVHQDGDRDGCQHAEHPLPNHLLEEIGVEDPQGDQGKQVAQAAAGIHHLELGHPDVDDVAADMHGDAGQADQGPAHLGRDGLEKDADRPLKDTWYGHHEDQEDKGQEKPPHRIQPEDEGGKEQDQDGHRGHGDVAAGAEDTVKGQQIKYQQNGKYDP